MKHSILAVSILSAAACAATVTVPLSPRVPLARNAYAATNNFIHPANVLSVLQGGSDRRTAPINFAAATTPTLDNLDGRNIELLLSEDFSAFVAGTEDAVDATHLLDSYFFGNPYLDNSYTSTPGWSGFGLYQAGGCCALAYPGQGGVLTTPEMNYQGKIYVSFRAKVVETEKKFLLVVGTMYNGIYFPGEGKVATLQINPEDGWKEYILELDYMYSDTKSSVQFNGMFYNKGKLLIDDIKVYRDKDFIYTPREGKGIDFTKDSFTATWEAIPNADSYRLNVYEDVPSGKGPYSADVDFENIYTETGLLAPEDVPEGWEISLNGETQVSATGGVDNSKALVLSSDADYIQFPVNGGRYTKLGMTFTPIKVTEYDFPSVTIEVLTGGEWTVYNDVNLYELSRGQNVEITIDEQYLTLFSGVRIKCNGIYEGLQVGLDNVSLSTTEPVDRNQVLSDKLLRDTSYVIDNINNSHEYYFTVSALKGEEETGACNPVHAFGLEAPEVLDATDVEEDGPFTARWEKVSKAAAYEVCLYSIGKVEESNPDYFHINEAFDLCKESKSLGNNEESYLDEYTGLSGWTGRNNCIIDGAIGTEQTAYDYSFIATPFLSLDNGGGKTRVQLRAKGTLGDYLMVQCSGEYIPVGFADDDEWQDVDVTFENGLQHDYVMFYSNLGYPVFIDDVKVSGAVEAGDELYHDVMQATTDELEYFFRISREPGKQYGYQVRAIQRYFNEMVRSEYSATSYVKEVNGVGATEVGKTAGVSVNGRTVTNPGTQPARIVNTRGMVIATLPAGASHTLSDAGVYIITVGSEHIKSVIK